MTLVGLVVVAGATLLLMRGSLPDGGGAGLLAFGFFGTIHALTNIIGEYTADEDRRWPIIILLSQRTCIATAAAASAGVLLLCRSQFY